MSLKNKVQSAYKSVKNNVGKAVVGATMLGIASIPAIGRTPQTNKNPNNYVNMLLHPHDKITKGVYNDNLVSNLKVISHEEERIWGVPGEKNVPRRTEDSYVLVGYSGVCPSERFAEFIAERNIITGVMDLYHRETGEQLSNLHFTDNLLAKEITQVKGGYVVELKVKIDKNSLSKRVQTVLDKYIQKR